MGFPPGLLHSSGALLVDDSGLISQAPGLANFAYANGLKLNNAGQLAVKLGGTVHTYNNGLPVTAEGELIVSYGTANSTISGIVPTLDLNFLTMNGVLDPRITFTRSSVATYFDSSGTLQTAIAGVPRFTYDPITLVLLGLLLEGGVTNQSTNNTFVGIVPGTPGTPPNAWTLETPTGLTRTIVGSGFERGIDYMDIRYQGSVAAPVSIGMWWLTQNGIATSGTQVWSVSSYMRRTAGSWSGVQPNIGIAVLDASFVFLTDIVTAVLPTNDPLSYQRFSQTSSINSFPGGARQCPRFRFDIQPNVPIDFTIRIGLPCMEGGVTINYPTRTTGANFTRQNDGAVLSGVNFSSWYTQGQGTVLVDYEGWGNINSYSFSISDGTTTTSIRAHNNSFNEVGSVTNAGTQASVIINTPNRLPYARNQVAMGWATNDVNISLNGQLGAKDTLAVIPVTVDRMTIAGPEGGSSTLFGAIKLLRYYPAKLSDSSLTELTEITFHVGGVLVGSSSVRITNA